MSKKILHLTDQDFNSKITKTNDIFLIDFWATWCSPCKIISSILDEIVNEYFDKITICKIDIDNNPKTASIYNIRSIPTLIILKYGKIIDKKIGVLSKIELKSFLDAQI